MTETVIKDVPPNWTTADAGDEGYRKSLQARHVNMIAIGGAIGTGLFLGAGGRLAQAGPSLAIAYAVCGLFAFFVVRALGELVLYRPVVRRLRLLRTGVHRGEGRLRRRLDVLPQLVDHRHRRHHRDRALRPLLVGLHRPFRSGCSR